MIPIRQLVAAVRANRTSCSARLFSWTSRQPQGRNHLNSTAGSEPQDVLRNFRRISKPRVFLYQRQHQSRRFSQHSSSSNSSNNPPNMDSALYSRAPISSELLAATLEKPDPDNREYRIIRLPNKLEALLIHDPDTDKASAALDVRAGAFCDEDDMPGMAHAVEHLLFMGTEKFPKENEYSEYLSARSGYSNAFTASLSTNYFFELAATADSNDATGANVATTTAATIPNGDVGSHGNDSEAYLYGALDRFAQFFIAPLFLEETLDRELKAVDSENKKNLQSDVWRLIQLDKSLSNPEHPYHGFSTGSLKTLRDDPLARGVAIRDRFMKFHKEHYSANRMKLVVLGRESLDKLQSWVEKLFANVPNKDLLPNRWDGIPVLTAKELLTEVRAKPVMETRSLQIQFPYPDEEHLFESRPSGYLSHLIDHGGPGSILAYLKAKGWVQELSAGAHDICPGAAMFTVKMSLTETGLKNYREVGKTVFHYISILKESPPQQWIFDEVKDMSQVSFRFRQKRSASSTTSGLSQAMQKPYPRERIMSALSVLSKFDPDAIAKGLECLNAENFRMKLVSQDCLEGKTVQKEKWYGTEFCAEQLPQDYIAELKKAASSSASERPLELHLPHKNEFIPSRLEVDKRNVTEPAKAPKLVRNDENVRLWYKKDDQFWVPKADLNILLRSPVCLLTARNVVMAQIYSDLIIDSLTDYAYDAELAELSYNLQVNYDGMVVNVSGFSDKMPVLLEKVLTTMKDLNLSKKRFDIIKERRVRGYRNWDFGSPFSQISSFDHWLNVETSYITSECYAELDSIELEDVQRFRHLMLDQLHIEVMANGSIHLEDALKAVDLTEKILQPRKLPASQWPVSRCVTLPQGSNYLYSRQLKDPSNINHCIQYTTHIGELSDRELYAKLLLFAQMTSEPTFDQLRTKEQLGYIVFSEAYKHATKSAYRILIQSERTPEYLEKRIDNFLSKVGQDIDEMSSETFESHKRSSINTRLQKLQNLGQESNRFWGHISDRYYFFDQYEDDAARIKKITKDEMKKFFKQFIDPTSPTRTKLCVHLVAQGTSADARHEKTPAEQNSELLTLVDKYLRSTGMEIDSEKLKHRFSSLDLSKKDQQEASITSTIKAYLTNDAGLVAEKVDGIMEEGKQMLGDALASVGIGASSSQDESLVASSTTPKTKEPTIIEDPRLFKTSLPLTAGPKPRKDLSEYEELAPKL